MTSNREDQSATTEVSRFPEYPWRVLTVFSAFVALILFCAAIWWCFFDAMEPTLAEARARIVTPFLAFMGAIVTFCAVMWRGTINSRQANEDRRRNQHQEDVNLALLFEKAVALLKDKESPEYSYALAMLETVAQGQNEQLARYALEQMLDEFALLCREFDKNQRLGPRYLETISRIFDEIGARAHQLPKRNLILGKMGTSIQEPGNLRPIFGSSNMPFNNVIYGNFTIDSERFRKRLMELGWGFVDCRFVGNYLDGPTGKMPTVDVRENFERCDFSMLKITSIVEGPSNYAFVHTFNNCDFSSAVFQNPVAFGQSLFRASFYETGSPPILAGGGKFSDDNLRYQGLYPKDAR